MVVTRSRTPHTLARPRRIHKLRRPRAPNPALVPIPTPIAVPTPVPNPHPAPIPPQRADVYERASAGILERLVRMGFSSADAYDGVQRMKSFLERCIAAGETLSTENDAAMDEAWHQFILDTRAYRDFNATLDKPLDHYPERARGGTLSEFSVCACGPGGSEVYQVTVATTVGELLAMHSRKTGVPECEMRIIHLGRKLDNMSKTLGLLQAFRSYNFHFILRLRGC